MTATHSVHYEFLFQPVLIWGTPGLANTSLTALSTLDMNDHIDY